MHRHEMTTIQRAFDISKRLITGEAIGRDTIAVDYRVTRRQAYRILIDMRATIPLTEAQLGGRTIYSLGAAEPAYSTGARMKESGQDAVEKNNDLFIFAMRRCAIAYLRENPTETVTIDRLRAIARGLELRPNHPNAWGCIFRTKDFTRVGFEQSKETSNRRRMVSIWKLSDD